MTYSTGQRALVEFIGTLALIFVGVGSILVNQAGGGGVGLPGIALGGALAGLLYSLIYLKDAPRPVAR